MMSFLVLRMKARRRARQYDDEPMMLLFLMFDDNDQMMFVVFHTIFVFFMVSHWIFLIQSSMI